MLWSLCKDARNRKLGASVHWWCHQVEQLCQLGPAVAGERTFGWNTSDLFVGADMFDVDCSGKVNPSGQTSGPGQHGGRGKRVS